MISQKQVVLLVFAVFLTACDYPRSPQGYPESALEFIGSNACVTCHSSEFDLWQGSDHQLAMQVATTESVLGDFSDIVLGYSGSSTLFFRKNGAFAVRTKNSSGTQQEFTITHTFGVKPLQQYLVDITGGRKQALPFAWDTRPAGSGGQRWYHLYPDEHVTENDPLHWTGRYFNWNHMCAECHSTNVEPAYDIESDTFNTTFSEVSVSCEACHGPGSSHIDQANMAEFDPSYGLAVDLDGSDGTTWKMNPDTGIAERSFAAEVSQQPESCGRCHARRSVLTTDYEYGAPLTDTHMPALLEEDLYFADGRIQDEVYVYGSFVQSKMYAAGVTCTDCHNPHSGKLHTGAEPNDVCATCHLPTKFANRAHAGNNSVDCVGCHMPATTYMGIDDRRDHSFRKPDTEFDSGHYGATIAAARVGPANSQLTTALANRAFPAIARATMLTQLVSPAGKQELASLAAGLDDPDPIVRIAALRSLRHQSANARMRYGSHLLHDAVRGVRIEATLTYANLSDLLPIEDARAYSSAANDYRAAMLAAASTPDAMTNLADFESRAGNTKVANDYFEHAIKLDREYAPARHVYGLFLARDGRPDEALAQLRAAVCIPRGSRGEPVWPPGWCGSISHSNKWVCAAAAPHTKAVAIGVDIEDLGRSISDGEIDLICTPEESSQLLTDLNEGPISATVQV